MTKSMTKCTETESDSVTLEFLCEMVRPIAAKSGLPESGLVLLAVEALARGNPILEKDHLRALEDYESITGVRVDRQVREALNEYIECTLMTNLEAIGTKSGGA